jgi:phage repressor protein C with HTH and peptisase S24 domain
METIGQRIRRLRTNKRLTQPQLAELCGWGESQSRISNYEKDLRTPKPDDAEKLAEILDVTAAYIMFGTDATPEKEAETFPRAPSEQDYALIRQYSTKGSCGNGFYNDHVEVIGELSFKRSWLNRLGISEYDACVIYATGDSMSPTIYDGDVVLIDQATQQTKSGEVYAILMDDEVIIKRLTKEFGNTLLRSDNTNKAIYPDISVPPGHDLHIIGRVVWRGGGL